MKKFIIPALAASAFMLYSCSTTQLASQAEGDDVYNTTATARVIQPRVAPAQNADDIATSDDRTYRTDEQLYGGGDYTDRDYDDNYRYGYASRINRFYYNSPWRTYYDYYGSSYYPWYSYQYDPFFYDPWNYRPGVSLWLGINSFPRSIFDYNYGYYGYSGYGYMGPYSYYNTYPGYRYGYGNGGYLGGYNRSSNPRPNRGGNDAYRPSNRGTIITGGQARTSTNPNGNRVSRDNNQPSSTSTRPRPTNPNSQASGRDASTTSTTRPAQTERPARVQRETPPARTTRETYSPPPSSDNGGSRSSGGNSGSSGGSSGGGRPSRGGR